MEKSWPGYDIVVHEKSWPGYDIVVHEKSWPGYDIVVHEKSASGQMPGSQMSWKNPGKVRARTYGTKSPSRSEALNFIDSAKFPSTATDTVMSFVWRSTEGRRTPSNGTHMVLPCACIVIVQTPRVRGIIQWSGCIDVLPVLSGSCLLDRVIAGCILWNNDRNAAQNSAIFSQHSPVEEMVMLGLLDTNIVAMYTWLCDHIRFLKDTVDINQSKSTFIGAGTVIAAIIAGSTML